MFRAALGGIVALVVTLQAAPAQGNLDCGEAYKRSLEKIERQTHAPERLAALSRKALRAYHACQTGDVVDAKGLFERLDRLKN